jgi:hypothetical protein
MRSFETTGTAVQTRKPSSARSSAALSPDICEFLDMLTAIENRSAAETSART